MSDPRKEKVSDASSEVVIFDRNLIMERDYWIKNLSQEIAASNLRLDYERPASYSAHADVVEISLTDDLYERLIKLTGNGDFLLYTTLMAALKVCLHKYTGQTAIIVGSPARVVSQDSNRVKNALVIVDEVSGHLSFRQLLLNVRDTLLEAYSRQRYPFHLLIKDLGIAGSQNRCPLFDIALELKNIHSDLPEVKNDMTISFVRESGRLAGCVTYDSSLFKQESIKSFTRHFAHTLRMALENTNAPISQLHLLTETEQRQMLVEWNDTKAEYPRRRIHQLFEQQVAATPYAIAIAHRGQQLSYEEFNRRANRLAWHLAAQEVGPGDVVALFAERGIDLLTAIMSVFKTGGAYLPLDPRHPVDRLGQILDQSRPTLILAASEFISPLLQALQVIPSESQPKVLQIDDLLLQQQPEDNRPVDYESANLAYVIYTSGSTGVPKGAMVEHRGMLNHLYSKLSDLKLDAADNIAQTASQCFDISVWQFLAALLVGGRVTIFDDEIAHDPMRLLADIDREKITIIETVPSMLRAMLDAGAQKSPRLALSALRWMIPTGEALAPDLCSQWLRAYPNIPLLNAYGPTECSDDVTHYPICEPLSPNLLRTPIGRPVANTQLYILDSQLDLLPVGAAGELCVGGEGVGRGYMNDSERTAEVFVPDAFSQTPGARLYTTGDLARYLPDGNVEFLGRIDYQVKIRGYRIEQSEIETVLGQHENVRAAVVITREEKPGEKYLAAYIVPNQEPACANDLRSYLKDKLPDYMIPSAFVILEAMPLMANGKIDRKALPPPDRAESGADTSFVAARNPVEATLAEMWAEVLGVELVGIHDNFFDLGGHSLLATHVISRVLRSFQIEMPLRKLFELPTIADFAESIEIAMKAGEQTQVQPIQRVSRDGDIPLSYAQQRLWFFDHLNPGNTAYNIFQAIRLSGSFNVEALEAALTEIMRRHESLRTTFLTVKGRPLQIIVEPKPVTIPLTDLSELNEDQRGDEAQRLALKESRTPFDLSQGPLFRITLLRLAEQDHVALFTMHHIISDGWSMGVLVSEVAKLYEAFLNGEDSGLSEPSIQYADYAVWQREWLEEEVLQRQKAYWKQQLAGSPPVLNLPTDRPRPPVQTFRGASQTLVFTEELSDALKDLSLREGATLFMTLLAAFNTLLYRYSGQEDILVGTPIAGRMRSETEGLIGFLTNTLVMRTDLSGDPSFREVLARVRETALEAYSHQDLPFENLVEELQPKRNLSHTPLFQVMFLFDNAPMGTIELPGLTLSPMNIEGNTSKFDLLLSLVETGRGVVGALGYNTDLFEASTIGRMLNHLRSLLESVVAQPDASISSLEMITESERRQLLVEWNNTKRDYPAVKLIHEMFELQAEKTPEAVAVVFEEQQLSYAQLNSQANELAHFLIHLGVGPDSLVGICAERSIEMIVGLMGILKAGGAYVPVDPQYPAERIAYMLEDSGVRLLLTQEQIAGSLPQTAARVVILGAEKEAIGRSSQKNPEVEMSRENLAYVIYTSGSTGKPKGAMNTHGGISNRLLWMQETYNLTSEDRVLQKTPMSFDVSVWEYFWPLITGARMVMAKPGGHQDSQYLVKVIKEEKVTTLHFVPSMLEMFIEEEGVEECESIKRVICSGEALKVEVERRYKERVRKELHNLYGPTECAVDVTYWECEGGEEERVIPIGRAIANTQVYVLDKQERLAGVGVVGELHIAGMPLGRGYLNKADTTAEKFIPNDFAPDPGSRMYKTGDLARYSANGSIEFLGRIDHQMKIRGFRIELGEIEITLSKHASVKDVVVIARRDRTGDHLLVAYIVPSESVMPTVNELRSYLKQILPEYMIPAAFVTLDELPLMPNGKLDLQALPALDGSRPELEEAFVPPVLLEEEVLAEIWTQVLGVERIGIHDNFFALGGDSIRSIQVLALAREQGLEFSLQDLFRYQTIFELARQSKPAEPDSATSIQTGAFSLISVDDRLRLPEGIEDAYPLTALQAGMLYHMELTPDSPLYHNVNSFHLRAPFYLEALEEAVQRAVARHASLRTSFDMIMYSEPLQLVHENAWLRVAVTDIRNLSFDEQEQIVDDYIKREKSRRFDLSTPPLLRFHIQRRSEDTFQFTLTECHAISDGWSLHATLDDIFKYYFALITNESVVEEPPLALTFRDFVHQEREAIQSDENRNYWIQQLSDYTTLELPRWTSSRSRSGSRIKEISVPISTETSEGLRQLAQLAGAPIKSVLMAAHIKALSLVSGQNEILTGFTTHGRPEKIGGEKVRGLFLNTVPFRQKLSEGNWLDLVRDTFETEQEMLPYRRYPLAEIQKNLGGAPLFETVFNYVHFHVVDGLLESGNVEVLDFKKVEETNFALSAQFSLNIHRAQVALELEYDSTELPEALVEAIRHYYASVLSAMAASPLDNHGDQDHLSPEERHQLLYVWNDTKVHYAGNEFIHEMFELQAEKTPEAVAVVFEEDQLSYAQLNSQANELAHFLIHLGVGPDSLVGICAERSIEMIVGLMGILKAGGAYVPVDPQYPAERIAYMLEDSGVRLLLTQEQIAGSLPQTAARVVILGAEKEAIGRSSQKNPEVEMSRENLAYVIYTSGSTGKPKGAMNTHGGISNRLLWMQETYNLTSEDRVLQKTPMSFDVSVWEYFWPLITGARMVMAKPGGHQDSQYLVKVIKEEKVTTLHFVPSMLEMFIEEEGVEECESIKRVICSGEALKVEVERRYKERVRKELHNLYGPTECAVDVTYWECEGGEEERVIPIGRAIANTQVYVLDKQERLAGVGVVGELHIAGMPLGRGYHNRPDLTGERFIPNPYSETEGGRLYKTGDLARYLVDGTIEYIARVDEQVKIRGFRIELGEIEATLNEHETVKQSVVVARADARGNNLLVAYIVVDEQAEVTVNDLRGHLMKKLPDYMIPGAFVILDELPLMPNGKLDRRSLAAFDHTRPELKTEYVAPRNLTEQTLADIWTEVLGLEKVGVYDSFFALGGHSLLAMQAISRIRRSFEVNLPLNIFLGGPTVAALAVAVIQSRSEEDNNKELDDILNAMEGLSDDEVQSLLSGEMSS